MESNAPPSLSLDTGMSPIARNDHNVGLRRSPRAHSRHLEDAPEAKPDLQGKPRRRNHRRRKNHQVQVEQSNGEHANGGESNMTQGKSNPKRPRRNSKKDLPVSSALDTENDVEAQKFPTLAEDSVPSSTTTANGPTESKPKRKKRTPYSKKTWQEQMELQEVKTKSSSQYHAIYHRFTRFR